MKALVISFLLLVSTLASAGNCEVFRKKSELGDRCPNYGLSYLGQRNGQGGSSGGCYRNSVAARKAMEENLACRNSASFGECKISLRTPNSPCPNFSVVDTDGNRVCFRTAEAAYEGMLSSPGLNCI